MHQTRNPGSVRIMRETLKVAGGASFWEDWAGTRLLYWGAPPVSVGLFSGVVGLSRKGWSGLPAGTRSSGQGLAWHRLSPGEPAPHLLLAEVGGRGATAPWKSWAPPPPAPPWGSRGQVSPLTVAPTAHRFFLSLRISVSHPLKLCGRLMAVSSCVPLVLLCLYQFYSFQWV